MKKLKNLDFFKLRVWKIRSFETSLKWKNVTHQSSGIELNSIFETFVSKPCYGNKNYCWRLSKCDILYRTRHSIYKTYILKCKEGEISVSKAREYIKKKKKKPRWLYNNKITHVFESTLTTCRTRRVSILLVRHLYTRPRVICTIGTKHNLT